MIVQQTHAAVVEEHGDQFAPVDDVSVGGNVDLENQCANPSALRVDARVRKLPGTFPNAVLTEDVAAVGVLAGLRLRGEA